MQTDYVQRFLFENLDIRGRLVCLTGAWQRMLDGRGYPEDIVSLLGRTTALNVLLGANQKGAGQRAQPAGRWTPLGDARGPEERQVLPEPGAARGRDDGADLHALPRAVGAAFGVPAPVRR